MMESNDERTVSADPAQFKFRQKAPSPKRKLNARSILLATGVFSTLSAGALIMAFSGSGRETRPLQKTERAAMPADAIRELPGDYTELAKRRPQPKAQKEQKVMAQLKAPEMSAEEKYLQELRLQRLKRAMEARASDVSFTGVKIERGGGSTYQAAAQGLNSSASPFQGEGALNPRDLDGRQDEKEEFLHRVRMDGTTLNQSLRSPQSPYQVSAGTVIPGVMVTGINSDLPGQLLGQVSQSVFDTVTGGILLIPQGTKILGSYDSKVVYGQERVLVVWTRLLFPNGRSISLEGMPGVDMSGYAGLSDSVNNHYLKLLTGVVLGSLLGAGAQIAEGSTNTIEPTFGQLAAQGFAKDINEAGQQITRKNLNIQPTLEVAPGFRFNVFVTKDIILEPYEA